MDERTFSEICERVGILDAFYDIWGNLHKASVETKKAILGAMGFNPDNLEETRTRLIQNEVEDILPPVVVKKENVGEIAIKLFLKHKSLNSVYFWEILQENGEKKSGKFSIHDLQRVREIILNNDTYIEFSLKLVGIYLPIGYHELIIHDNMGELARTTIICTPSRAYQPESLERGERLWGPAIQIYALRSLENFGIGDFGDLAKVLEYFSRKGASIIGINPINALFPANPSHNSPYSPSSRYFLNPFYISIEKIPEINQIPIRDLLSEENLLEKIEKFKGHDYIRYQEVGQTKLKILEKIWGYFNNNLKHTRAYEEFKNFVDSNNRCYYFGVFNALYEYYLRMGIYTWDRWEAGHQDPKSDKVREFAQENMDRVRFYQFLEWLSLRQLHELGNLSLSSGLKIGLYGDLPVSVDPFGFDVWYERDLYAFGIGIGAPPDDFSPKGQNWGLVPFNPITLRKKRYKPFIELLRFNMKYFGAIRIDHVMALHRLYWIPRGMEAKDGAYVKYDLSELIGILALESVRNMTLVIGEDLGTVPDEVREKMRENGIFSYKVLYFEKNPDGSFKMPNQYEQKALLTVTTHDLPTLRGFWNQRDIVIRTLLDLFPSEEIREKQVKLREYDKKALCYLLLANGLLDEGKAIEMLNKKELEYECVKLIHKCLSHANSQIFMIQLEDILYETEQMNLPGITGKYPNWSRKYTKSIEEIIEDEEINSFLEVVSTIRK